MEIDGKAQSKSPGSTGSSTSVTVLPAGPVAAASNEKQVLSPFVGTFYRAASPESDPYAREGQVIKRGDVLCIIEAMKLMNEIDAEFPGKIKSVLVENGQPVEFGEPLFMIEI
ncbi:MAG: acetyl-CoA carboxylase biotin carboxyl carrier protein [Bdellovibrionia bacterium]